MSFKAKALNFGIAGIAVVSPVLLTANPVFAETTTGNSALQQAQQLRCEKITQRIDSRITNFDDNKQKHITRYENIANSVSNLVSRLEKKGYDVTEVRSNLQTLNQMIIDLGKKYTDFIDTLKAAKTFGCGTSDGQFKTQVELALTKLEDFRAQTKSTIDFVKNTLRPSIQKLKDQKPVSSTVNRI